MERIDDLQYNGLRLIQDDEQFCFGCDAVELANFVEAKREDRVLDIGCGNGIMSVLIAAKRGSSVVGVEVQAAAASLASRNAELNGLSGRMTVVNARIQDYAKESVNAGSFDTVVCNPPYRKAGSGMRQENPAVAIARHEIAVTLSEIVDCAARLVKSGGRVYLLGQCERLSETMTLCENAGLAVKELQVLRPSENKPPHLFMIKCLRGGSGGLKVLPERTVRAYGV